MTRARRSLQGLWIGDAFGGCFFWKPDLAERVRDRVLPPDEWRWSDDTAMGKSVLECLEQYGRIVPDELARMFAEEYHRAPTRGYGTMAHTYLHSIGQGAPWQEATRDVFDGKGSFGNGAAMRVGPVGAYFAGDVERVIAEAIQSAIVTHAHPEGQAGAVAIALAAAWASENPKGEGKAMLEFVLTHTPVGETRDNLERALDLSLESRPQEAAALLGSGQRIISQDTVPFALWCAARHLDSLSEALWATVAGEGDMDTTCAMVGSIVALCAENGIPEDWRNHAEPLSD
ncbi:MAG: ADP-ribosylglycohydrolase family protein [Candidatus Eremiobacteraeota bacterium]|nr:ADP-ribosylglycohydrolase family protein [Candidatus Eremiobacteraeota bacterium]